jgi:putative transposase
MPRNARLDMPGLLQHVIVRGIERRDIFLDDEDREWFLKRFSSLLTDTGTGCYAWALMTNHFHLLLVTSDISLGGFMRRLLTGYAVTFNRKHIRSGHLFQNRYKSIVCEEETYLLELVRYIHLNPLRAGMVKSIEALNRYPWSGHAVLMGNRQTEGQLTEEVLGRFGRTLGKARRKYQEFVADGISLGRRPELIGGGLRRSQGQVVRPDECESFDERILGGGGFVDHLLEQAAFRDRFDTKLSLGALIDRVAVILSLSPDDIRRPSKKRVLADARGVICHAAVRDLHYQGNAVGNELNLTASGVSNAIRRGEQYLQEHQAVKGKLQTELVK